MTANEKDICFDREHIWHPYTNINNPLPVQKVTGANGVYLYLENDKQLIDGMSSWWCAIHGYNHPVLNKAAKEQTDKMSHVMFGGLTHQPAIDLAKKLIEITPDSLQYVFFADSGSVAVEVAIKMATQYWFNQGKANKHKLLTIKKGYHGDTFGAMSVCDPVTGMHSMFKNVLTRQIFAESPSCKFGEVWQEESINNIKLLIEKHHKQISALILEPVVQGAGGMNFYHPQYLNEVRELCNHYDILLIFDEIATGFGRTGKLFATEHTAIEPDILCLGKALTGGYMTLSATLSNEKIARGVSKNNTPLMHGPTFMGNPLACSVSLASIDLLLNSDWQQNVLNIQQRFEQTILPLSSLSAVKNTRVLGAIGVVEMNEAVDIASVQDMFIEEGVWIRPFGKLIYTMPAYNISDQQLDLLLNSFEKVIKKL